MSELEESEEEMIIVSPPNSDQPMVLKGIRNIKTIGWLDVKMWEVSFKGSVESVPQ
jgi:hypothetical protein